MCVSCTCCLRHSAARRGGAVSNKPKHTHTHRRALAWSLSIVGDRSASLDRRWPLKNDNNSAYNCNSVFKGSVSINSLTRSVLSDVAELHCSTKWSHQSLYERTHLRSHYSASLHSNLCLSSFSEHIRSLATLLGRPAQLLINTNSSSATWQQLNAFRHVYVSRRTS